MTKGVNQAPLQNMRGVNVPIHPATFVRQLLAQLAIVLAWLEPTEWHGYMCEAVLLMVGNKPS